MKLLVVPHIQLCHQGIVRPKAALELKEVLEHFQQQSDPQKFCLHAANLVAKQWHSPAANNLQIKCIMTT
jgi:hypothetical protein